MKIIAVFANRTVDPDVIELVTAWDEFSVDANYQGWLDDKKRELDSWGEDLYRHVEVEIEVPMSEIYRALIPGEITLEASSVEITEPES